MLGLASELRADVASSRFPAALSTGLVIAVLMVVVQTSIAAIIFSGPLVPFVGQGTGAILFGAFAMCLIVALSGTYKGTISVPHFAPAAALFGVGGGVAASMTAAPEEAVFATMVVIIALSALTTALLFGLVGWFRLANLSRFMPYPLVGGFLGGLGWFLVLSGVSITCGITLNWETFPELFESDTVWRWGPSLAFALALLVVTKLRPTISSCLHRWCSPSHCVTRCSSCLESPWKRPARPAFCSSACRRTPLGRPFNPATSLM